VIISFSFKFKINRWNFNSINFFFFLYCFTFSIHTALQKYKSFYLQEKFRAAQILESDAFSFSLNTKTFYGVNILKIKCSLHSFHQKGYFHFRKKFLNNCTNILGEHLYSNLFNTIFYIETNANWYYRKFFITLKLFHSLILGNFFLQDLVQNTLKLF